MGPHELMCELRKIPSFGMPIERRGPVTVGAVIDARATISAIMAANNAIVEGHTDDGVAARQTAVRENVILDAAWHLLAEKALGR